MDLSAIKCVEKTFEIVTPTATKDGTGVFITIMSPDDDRLKNIRSSVGDKVLTLNAKGKAQKFNEVEHSRKMILFKAITKWEWKKDSDGEEALWNGEKPDLTQLKFMEIVDSLPWFLTQIDEHFSESESFFQKAG